MDDATRQDISDIYNRLRKAEAVGVAQSVKIEELQKDNEAQMKIASSVLLLTEQMKVMNGRMESVTNKLDAFERKPAQTLTAVKMAAISALTTTIVALLYATIMKG